MVVEGGSTGARRRLALLYTDLWSSEEVSAARTLTSGAALIVTALILLAVTLGS